MPFEFNAVLDRVNCHIRAVRTNLPFQETPNNCPHKHYSIEFHCVFSGQEIITLPHENREITLTEGMVLLLPQGIYHGVYTNGTSVERICFNFSAEPMGKESCPIMDLFLNMKEPAVFSGDDTVSLMKQCYILCSQTQGSLLEVQQGMLFMSIALGFMCRLANTQTKSPSANALPLQQKWIIEDYINLRCTDHSGIEGLAKALFLSQRQTSTLVKRFFGEDYKTLVLRRRMELAEIYLQDFNKSLEEIACEVGYRSYSGFELCFKRHFGMTPTQKRTQIQQKRKSLL